jgi:hypothetical protein
MTLDEIGIFLIGCGVGGLLVLAYVWPCIPSRKAEPLPPPHQSISHAPPEGGRHSTSRIISISNCVLRYSTLMKHGSVKYPSKAAIIWLR